MEKLVGEAGRRRRMGTKVGEDSVLLAEGGDADRAPRPATVHGLAEEPLQDPTPITAFPGKARDTSHFGDRRPWPHSPLWPFAPEPSGPSKSSQSRLLIIGRCNSVAKTPCEVLKEYYMPFMRSWFKDALSITGIGDIGIAG